MHIDEHVTLLMARQRIQEAERRAQQLRGLRLARAPRQTMRVRVGMALVRFGHWIMGRPTAAPGTPIALRQARS
jgi:hypothetical protein